MFNNEPLALGSPNLVHIHLNTFTNFTENNVSSYLRSAAIHHFVNGRILLFCSGQQKFTKLGMGITQGTLYIITGNDVTGCFRSAAQPPFWFFTLRHCYPKRFHRISPNLTRWTYRPSDIFAWNNDVIKYSLSAAMAILKTNLAENELLVLESPNLIQRFTTTPSIILPKLVALATSGRQQSAILIFLHYAVALRNDSIELHQIW